MKQLLIGVSVALLLDCGGKPIENANGNGSAGIESLQPSAVSTNYSTSMGGYLQNSEVSLSILPNSLPNDTVITATPVKNPAPIGDPNVVAVSAVYEFGPDGSSFDFAHKPIMTFKFDPNKVIELGGDPSALSIAWYDPHRGLYVGEGGTIDPLTNTIRGRVEHFTQYLVISLTQIAANNNHTLVGAASFVPATPVAAAPIYVRQTVRDSTNLNPISSVRLYYKIGTAPGPLDKWVAMNLDAMIPSSPERYAGLIPADDVTTAGILYEIRATNSFGNVRSSGTVAININRTLCSVNIPTIGANNNQITVGFNRQFTLAGQAAVACPTAPVAVPALVPESATVSSGIGTIANVGSNGYLFTATNTGTSTINFSFGTVNPFAATINQTVIAGSIASLQILDNNLLPIQGTLGITAGNSYQFNLRALDSFGNEYGAIVATSWDTTGGVGSFPSALNGQLITGAAAPGSVGSVIARIGGYGPPFYIGAITASVNVQIHSGPNYAYLGGTDGSSDSASITPTQDGGVVIAGTSASAQSPIGGVTALNPASGSLDGIVTKLDANGSIQWYTYLGGPGADNLLSIKQTTDGGYIASGIAGAGFATLGGVSPRYPHSGNALTESIIIKLSSGGTVQWWTFLGFAGTITGGAAYDVIQTSEGGYAVIAYIAPTSPGVNTTQIETLHGVPVAGAYRIHTYDGEAYMTKLNSLGYIQWWRVLPGDTDAFELPKKILQTATGDYIIAGYSYGPFGPSSAGNGITETDFVVLNNFHGTINSPDITLTKVRQNGTLAWINYIGGTDPDVANSLAIAPDGGYLIGGYSSGPAASLSLPVKAHSGTGTYDYFVVKTNANGNVLWHTYFGGGGSDELRSLATTKDGGFIVAGNSNSSVTNFGGITPNFGLYNAGGQDGLIVKYDSTGNTQWYEYLGANQTDFLESVAVSNDGSVQLAGSSPGSDVTNFLSTGNLLMPYAGIGGIRQQLYVKLRANGSF